jgi:hypothetical protein
MWFVKLTFGFLIPIAFFGNVGAAMWGYFMRGDIAAGFPVAMVILAAVAGVAVVCAPIALFQIK